MATWNLPTQDGSIDKSTEQQQQVSAQNVAPLLGILDELDAIRQQRLVSAQTVAPPLNPVVREPSSEAGKKLVFDVGVTLEGKIEGDANIRIAGNFKGEIQIKGDLKFEGGGAVNAANLSLDSELNGKVVAGAQVSILEFGRLVGELKTATLVVASGSRMRGHVEFGWSVSEIAKFPDPPLARERKSRKIRFIIGPVVTKS